MNTGPTTVDEIDAALEAEPWLSCYLEPGDVDLDAARRRYERDQLLATSALRSAGVVIATRYVHGELLTTAFDRESVR